MSKTDLEVTIAHDGDVTVAELDGPVDSAMLDIFKNALDPVCSRPGHKVILDCARLTYLNSRAIGLLVKYHRSLSLSRGRLALCSLNTKLVRTLELLQLGKALRICSTREEALAGMK